MSTQDRVAQILAAYDARDPRPAADALQALWLSFEPKSVAGIRADQRAQQETVGIPVPDLKAIGKALGKTARKRVEDFLPLMELLWDEYGREGRVVALIPLGQMEQTAPERVVPILHELCRSCVTWEDADRLAMDALEPVVRAAPETWLERIEPWLEDESKWVRRAAVTVIGRLPMKCPAYTSRCLALIERLLLDPESEVKRRSALPSVFPHVVRPRPCALSWQDTCRRRIPQQHGCCATRCAAWPRCCCPSLRRSCRTTSGGPPIPS